MAALIRRGPRRDQESLQDRDEAEDERAPERYAETECTERAPVRRGWFDSSEGGSRGLHRVIVRVPSDAILPRAGYGWAGWTVLNFPSQHRREGPEGEMSHGVAVVNGPGSVIPVVPPGELGQRALRKAVSCSPDPLPIAPWPVDVVGRDVGTVGMTSGE